MAKKSTKNKYDGTPRDSFDIYLAKKKQKAETEAAMPPRRGTFAQGRKPGRPKSVDPRVMVGAGLKTSEKFHLEAIAKFHGVTFNTLIAFFIRNSLREYADERLKIPTESRTTIKMP